jgi:hypothetical protein
VKRARVGVAARWAEAALPLLPAGERPGSPDQGGAGDDEGRDDW